MQIATTQKVVNALSPARRVPDMRRAAVNTNVTANPVRPLYQRLHRPTSSRTRLAATPVAAKQIKPAPRVLASRTITTASAPRLPKILARARADYKQNADSKIGKTRIPRPTITAVKEASVRRQSRLWARMTSVVIRRKITVLAAETTTEAEVDEEELYEEVEKPTMEFEEPASEIDEPADDDMDNTSLMFNDNSFDDSVSPEQQTSAMNLFGRKMVSMKRLGMGLRTNRDWFVGLSRCPDYTGDSVGLERVRSRTTVTTESHLTQDASEGGKFIEFELFSQLTAFSFSFCRKATFGEGSSFTAACCQAKICCCLPEDYETTDDYFEDNVNIIIESRRHGVKATQAGRSGGSSTQDSEQANHCCQVAPEAELGSSFVVEAQSQPCEHEEVRKEARCTGITQGQDCTEVGHAQAQLPGRQEARLLR